MDLSDLQSARKRIGVKQTIKALESDSVALVYIAGDADRQVNRGCGGFVLGERH